MAQVAALGTDNPGTSCRKGTVRNAAQLDDSSILEDTSEERTVLLTADRRACPVGAALPDDGECLVGETISHYHVKELIGRGSFGVVYRAVDSRLERDVAIKFAACRIVQDPQLRELYRNEARVQARLEHSNIVPIYDLVEESGRMAMVMRLVHGEDLDKRLKQMVRPFTPAETLRLMRQVGSAVGAAHDRGVIHQDLKPGNIRLTPDAEAVVLDFGAARVAGQMAPDEPGMTGTPAYMSPEQICGESIDARSDIYALAMTLYKTLTGHHPFEDARNLGELLAWQVDRAPPSPTRYNPHLPPALAEAILRGLAKNPRDRFRACGDLTHALSAGLGLEDAAPTTDDDARWNPRARIGLAAQVFLPGDQVVDARVSDLSISGAGLRLAQPLGLGLCAGLVIRIPLKNSQHVVRCSMQVVKAMPDSDASGFRVGVSFQCLGDYDQAVLADLVRAVLIQDESN